MADVAPESVADTPKRRIFFRCDVSVSTPNFTDIFMESGGQINSMAAKWQTDFSLSGSAASVPLELADKQTSKLSVEIADAQLTGESSVELPSNVRLNAMSQRMCAAINGTLATSLSAESSEFLYNILRGGSHFQTGMVYKTFAAHAAALGVSNARIVAVDESGTEVRCKPTFVKLEDNSAKILEAAGQISEEYVKSGFNMRQAVVYKPSPMLHKTVFSEIVGVNGRGYSLLHSIMDRKAFVSLDTLEALYEAAVACDCCQDRGDIESFRSATDRPGMAAAMEARTVASATSLIVNVLMSYRADGRNIVTPQGTSFAAVENWNNSVPRSCIETNDCDGLALLAVALIRSAVNLTPAQLESGSYPYLRSVRNAVFPHYQLALSVIGATAAEANSAKADHSAVAGHAITVLVPTMSFLRALHRAVDKQIGKEGPLQSPPEEHSAITAARFAALYPAETLAQLPANEKALLASWESARHELAQLQALAIEGTTPASPVLYQKNPDRRAEATREAQRDKAVFSMAAPNVFRSIKMLHVGGSASGSTHVFYSELVELTFAPDSPLYTSPALRSKNAAASQYVLTTHLDDEHVSRAGCTPRHLVMEEYGALPLVNLNAPAAHVLDAASDAARRDVMPPRRSGPLQLSEYQSKTLAESMAHVAELEKVFAERTSSSPVRGNHHCVAYTVALNTLVHNPNGVKQFVDTMKRVAVSGVVDKRVIPGLARDASGGEAGMFLHLDVYCAL